LNHCGDFCLDYFVQRHIKTIDVFRVKLDLAGRALEILVHLVFPAMDVHLLHTTSGGFGGVGIVLSAEEEAHGRSRWCKLSG
jgi:hypothetical protein